MQALVDNLVSSAISNSYLHSRTDELQEAREDIHLCEVVDFSLRLVEDGAVSLVV